MNASIRTLLLMNSFSLSERRIIAVSSQQQKAARWSGSSSLVPKCLREVLIHSLLLDQRVNLIQLGRHVFGQVLCAGRRDQNRIFQPNVYLLLRNLQDRLYVESIAGLQCKVLA